MTGYELELRVVRDDGVILVEHRFDSRDQTNPFIEMAAVADAEQALAALEDGHAVTLEVRDPMGDIGPAGEWVIVDVRRP